MQYPVFVGVADTRERIRRRTWSLVDGEPVPGERMRERLVVGGASGAVRPVRQLSPLREGVVLPFLFSILEQGTRDRDPVVPIPVGGGDPVPGDSARRLVDLVAFVLPGDSREHGVGEVALQLGADRGVVDEVVRFPPGDGFDLVTVGVVGVGDLVPAVGRVELGRHREDMALVHAVG